MIRDPQILEKVKAILNQLTQIAPGKSVEVRIPPYAAVQCVDGLTHRRGTPPNIVEMNCETLFDLANGAITFAQGVDQGLIHATGGRSDIGGLFEKIANETKMGQ